MWGCEMKKIAILCIIISICFAGKSFVDNEGENMSLSTEIYYFVSDPGGMG